MTDIKIFLALLFHTLRSPVKLFHKAIEHIRNRELLLNLKKVYKIQRLKFAQQKIYEQWLVKNKITEAELEAQRTAARAFTYRPLISILTPVFNPPATILQELIEAVQAQTYDNFELCLGNFGDNEEVREVLDVAARADPRIKVWQFPNKGIGENSNTILARAKGEYVALLDHDDLIEPNALYEHIQVLNTSSKQDFIYSDSDKIDELGNRSDPFFKPDWSPEMMLSGNYVTHFDLIRKKMIDDIGGWDPHTDGAQDWDLFLRISQHTDKIAHIPKILYHWRMISSSTAHSMDAKPYVISGQQMAVNKFLQDNKYPGVAHHNKTELFIEWQTAPVHDTVCLVLSHAPESLRLLLREIAGAKVPEHVHFVIFHPYSLDDSSRMRQMPSIEYVHLEPGEYLAKLKEYLARQTTGQNIWFFDDHLKFAYDEDNILASLGWLNIPEVFGAAPRILDRHKICTDLGAVYFNQKIRPIFVDAPVYRHSSTGNSELVRNLHILNHLSFFTTVKKLKLVTDKLQVRLLQSIEDEQVLSFLQLNLGFQGRLVMNPKSIIVQRDDPMHSLVYYEKLSKVPAINEILKSAPADAYTNENLYTTQPSMFDV